MAPVVERKTHKPQELTEPLSAWELEVLQLIAQGLNNQEIADKLFLAQSTINKHINNIFGKLSATHRAQAVARARVRIAVAVVVPWQCSSKRIRTTTLSCAIAFAVRRGCPTTPNEEIGISAYIVSTFGCKINRAGRIFNTTLA